MKDTIKTIGGLFSVSVLVLTGRALYLKGKIDAIKELQEESIEPENNESE